ncbi:MAG: DNA mismatch repair endonuclease MutL [Bacteroidales bacterium]|jgi:DNA mismatch repair protein MutL|nr:DNA mismatch repair endonuclease MutL [Bacteroidales bacterium]
MPDIIHLLPEHVANQIAAGEVVQRPASAVKELIENSVDSGATHIQLIVKDSGKTLIQVVDNGNGMSFSDARLCFERHATSKITQAEDLFCLKTKGFRGEALASIAAIAHVELKTKQAEDTVGTQILIEGSVIKEHIPTATQDGTSIAVKNLFFNVPARRNFLKSDSIEYSHIEEEFYRVALIHTDIAFTFYHNNNLIVQLPIGNFKNRIINIFGNHLKDKLYPMEQITGDIAISGFIAKPENARKRKNDQYLFVNNRFVSHFYLKHAVESAYKEMIPEGYKPAFFIKIDLDPASIDVNISPTKVDVKFQDEKLIYGILHATVRKSLGSLSLTPRLDFDYEPGMDVSQIKDQSTIKPPTITLNPDYNPFQSHSGSTSHSSRKNDFIPNQSFQHWDQFLTDLKGESEQVNTIPSDNHSLFFDEKQDVNQFQFLENDQLPCFTFSDRYLVCHFDKQITVIDILHGRERILYEHYLDALQNNPIVIQQNLFPEIITLSSSQAEMVIEIKKELFNLGFDLEQIDSTSFAVNGTPNEEESINIQETLIEIINLFRTEQFLNKNDKYKNLALTMSKQKRGKYRPFQSQEERIFFIRQLFKTMVPTLTPSGNKTMYNISIEHLPQFFE